MPEHTSPSKRKPQQAEQEHDYDRENELRQIRQEEEQGDRDYFWYGGA